MTCSRCLARDTAALVVNASGLMEPVCEECQAKPKAFPDGSYQGRDRFVELTEHLSIEMARANAAIECLRVLVQQFEREMKNGYTTSEQQAAIRRAKEMIG